MEKERKGKFGVYAMDVCHAGAYWEMKKVGGVLHEARSRGRSSPDTLAFLSLRNTQTIEPVTA